MVNIYHWHARVFQGAFSKLAADLPQTPRTPLCWTFMKNHEAGLGIGSAAPQPAVNTPCILCSAAGPVLLNISQCHSHQHNTQPTAWKTFTTIMLLGLCWAAMSLKVRCHIVSNEPQKSNSKGKQSQYNSSSFSLKKKNWKKYLPSSEFIFHFNLLISQCCSWRGKESSATVRVWEPGLQTGTGKEFSELVAQAEICLKLYN